MSEDLLAPSRATLTASTLALVTAGGTLVCCVLPAVMVALGAGAALAGLVTAVPQLVWLSMHKALVFGVAAVMLVVAGVVLHHAQRAPCPTDAALGRACMRLRRASLWIYWIAVALTALGASFAFLLPLQQANAEAEPAATVDAFFAAVKSGDLERAKAFLDPEAKVFESGAVERSAEEYATRHLPADAEFLKDATLEITSRSGDAVGDLAWVASEQHIKTVWHGKAIDLISTETMVLHRTAAGWRIVHIHWSSRPKEKAA